MDNAAVITQDTKGKRASVSKVKAVALYMIWGGYLIFRGVADLKFHHSHTSQVYFALLVWAPILGGSVLCLLGLFLVFGMGSIGTVDYEQITDFDFERRVRERYASEANQLTALGFRYAFTSSESMSLVRLLLIYPAVIWLQMRMKGEIIALRGGKLFLGLPIFSSADGRSFGHPFGLGTKFHTGFRNGQILVTKTFGDDCVETSQFVVQGANRTIAEAWQAHTQWLAKLDTETNPANRDRSYQAYVSITRREDALMKSQG